MSDNTRSVLRELVAQVLHQQPAPPRRVSYWAVFRAAGSEPATWVFVLFAVTSFILAVVVWSSGTSIGWRLGGIGAALLAVLSAATPFVWPARIVRALRQGVLSVAEVTRLDRVEMPSRRSLEAMQNGYASGVRRVDHSVGAFDQPFEFDGPGASQLRVGSEMQLLVSPQRKAVLLDVARLK